jgi:TolB-like protein
MSLYNELKRRNVFRVAIAYLAGAWLLIEVAGTLFPAFGVPDWAVRFVVIVLALGFLPTLIISWAYEMTSEGLKREKDVVREASTTHLTAKRLDGITIGLILLAVAFIMVDRIWLSPKLVGQTASNVNINTDEIQDSESESMLSQSPPNSIAVLPFVNMSSDTEQEYFSDGITEEILNNLAKVNELRVAGRTSSFAFKGQNQDLREIGNLLGVKFILEGSVRKSGNTVRITAQLIQVEDGFHLWSESYDRELTNIFAIQDEISSAILQELKAELLEEDASLISATRTKSKVYDLYLLARQQMRDRNQATLELSVKLLQEAIDIDPGYAPAHAQLGIATMLLSESSLGTLPYIQAEEAGRAHLETALQFDQELPEGLAGMGLYFQTKGLAQLDESNEWLRKALEINPNLTNASSWLADNLSVQGQLKKSFEIVKVLFERDPLYKPGFAALIRLYVLTGQNDKAFGVLSDLKPFLQHDAIWLQLLGFVQMFNGQWAEANKNLRSALEMSPTDSFTEHWLSQLLVETAQYEDCLELGVDYICTLALSRLGQPDNARSTGGNAVGNGHYPCWFFWASLENGDHAYLVNFVESRWDDLDAFELDFQDNAGWGSHAMTSIADAYAHLGQEDKFADALSHARISNNRQIMQGANNAWMSFTSAHIAVLSGDFEQAMTYLETGFNQGGLLNLMAPTSWPMFKILEGNPRYDNLKIRMLDKLNTERTKMGLSPRVLESTY